MKKMLLRFLAGDGRWPARIVRSTFLTRRGHAASQCLVLIVLALWSSADVRAQANAGASVATRYMEALQKGDFKTVIDLSYGYQSEVNQIKAQNPQVLWPKLTKEYQREGSPRSPTSPPSGKRTCRG